MSKKDIIKTLDIASFIAAIAATLLVLVFQFRGSSLAIKTSIIMYAVCFLTLAVVLGFKVYEVFSNKMTEDAENSGEPKTTKQKVLAVLWLALLILAFVCTCVLLALY